MSTGTSPYHQICELPRVFRGARGNGFHGQLWAPTCVYDPHATGWDDVADLELATLSWVHWFNHDRLHAHCDHVSPAEHEAAFYGAQHTDPTTVGTQ